MSDWIVVLVPWVLGMLACGLVSVVQLREQYNSWPFGDRGSKALIYWFSLCTFDACVGVVLCLIGASLPFLGSVDVVVADRINWAPIFMVPLVALALRSPVRRVQISGQQVDVGITEIYDRIRLFFMRRIDDRQTALNRADTYRVAGVMAARGVLYGDFSKEAEEHFENLKQWSPAHRAEMLSKLVAIETIPDDIEKFRALVTLVKNQGLDSMIEEYRRPALGG